MSLLVGLDRDCGAAALGVTVVYNFRTCHVRYGLVPFECAFRRHQRQNMDRRGFLNKSRFALMTAAFLELVPDLKTSNGQVLSGQSGAISSTYQLTKTNDPDAVADLYQPGAKGLGPAATPYVYAFYDENSKKFLNPLANDPNGVKPSLDKGSYTMSPSLLSFNIRQADQAKFMKLKNQVQLSFNATAPISKSDQLSWIFMNAVDVFLAKDDKGRQDQLTKFTSNNKTGTQLNSNPKISVEKGSVTLQVTAFGQKEDSFWTKFFDVIAKVAGSPIISTASKGFGVPGLVTEAVTFVDGVLDSIAQQNKLVSLWQTGGLEFAVTKDASARFNMKPGLWATVDSDYAQQTNFLEGHALDLQYQSFRITDKVAKPVDTNYLVMDVKFPSS